MHQRRDSRNLIELLMVSNFVEVFLARQGHLNKVGVNFLEKVQLPHLASIYGAMLAGVGYVLMGAGIPLHIPGVLDNLAAGKPAEYKLAVTGAAADAGHDDALRSAGICGRAAAGFWNGRGFWRLFRRTRWRRRCCGGRQGAWMDW